MVESAQTNLVGPSETVLASALPFAFAQSRGVLLEKSASSTTLYFVPPLATEVLLEVQRYLSVVASHWNPSPMTFFANG